MKNYIYLAISLFVIGCTANQDKKDMIPDKIKTIETIAVQYFEDSLWRSKNIFPESDLEDSTGIYIKPSLSDSLYENGLFLRLKIYSDQYLAGISKPYVKQEDMIDFREMYSISELTRLDSLYKNYNAMIRVDSSYFEEIFEVSDSISLMSLEDFEKTRVNDALYMEVHKAITQRDTSYVQLTFKNYVDFPMYEVIEIYVSIDKNDNVIGWFLN